MRPYIRTLTAMSIVALTALGLGVVIGRHVAPRAVTPAVAPPALALTPTSYDRLAGWTHDGLADAGPALAASCKVFASRDGAAIVGEGPAARSASAWQHACAQLKDVAPENLRAAIEANFVPFGVASPDGERGLFTGYYEVELNAARTADARYHVPIYGVPRDLVTVDLPAFVPALPPTVPRQIVGRVTEAQGHEALQPYFTREQIDRDGAVADRADVLLWADDPVAVHILHIQGSGRAVLPDGQHVRVGFAGHNGRQFQGIGGILLKAGVLKSGEGSMDKVRAWLVAHPTEAETYMNRNGRYIFFQLRADTDAPGPVGALGVPLTPGRSLAVDGRLIPLGAPLWLDTADPDGHPVQRLMFAQDTGAAITGAVRGDVYWGTGEAAFAQAARMRSPGRYVLLLPRVQ